MRLILVVEDLPEEQLKAKLAVKAAGFKPIVAGTYTDALRLWNRFPEQVLGVVTDVHFPRSSQDSAGVQPNGLAIVAEAVWHGVPVSVCSDIDHHFAEYVKNVIQVLASHQSYAAIRAIPLTMDRKNWDTAVRTLVALISKLEGGET